MCLDVKLAFRWIFPFKLTTSYPSPVRPRQDKNETRREAASLAKYELPIKKLPHVMFRSTPAYPSGNPFLSLNGKKIAVPHYFGVS